MEGNITDKMCAGIDDSAVFVVFVTQQYITKVQGQGPKGEADNCRREFSYALNKKTEALMVAVVLEPSCLNQAGWSGQVGLLSNHLYVDMSAEITEEKLDELKIVINACIQRANKTTAPIYDAASASATLTASLLRWGWRGSCWLSLPC
jgi:hypothetical protein